MLVKIVLLALLSVVSYGDDFQDGLDAINKKDYISAFQIYNKACDNNESGGCMMVGSFYKDGLVVQKSNQLALVYFAKACDMGNSNSCKDYKNLQNEIPVCTEDELSFLNNKRYFNVASSDSTPSIVADSKTIRIDKKNKVIQVWITFEFNKKGKDDYIHDYGQNYNNFGYSKFFYFINYRNMTNKNNTSTYYNCDGSFIETIGSGQWSSIIPDSVMEGITETIMKKYHLK